MSLAAKLAAGALVLLAIAAGTFYVRELLTELAERTHELDDANKGIESRDATIKRLRDDAEDKAKQQRQLDQTRASVAAQLTDVLQENRRLRDENASVREWSDTALPFDVARLHNTPAATGAADYRAGMPVSEPLYVPGDGAPQ
ncbi:Rz-like lysis system protein LysB [Paraburkholderia oxyphila]|uniref:Rz-like lysis system protein LysB n=1 Tax=Paraburkholderia oxyphila TaxID=614212 RepID=UPI0004828F20|nr:Rz-like lysis system protein LysB [Paraburkholderia oxyphila]